MSTVGPPYLYVAMNSTNLGLKYLKIKDIMLLLTRTVK